MSRRNLVRGAAWSTPVILASSAIPAWAASVEACTPAFADYVGTPYDESSLDTTWFFPSSNGWDTGDRIIVCVAVPLTEDSLSQSVKNTGM